MTGDERERNVKSDVIFSDEKDVARVFTRIKRVDDSGYLLCMCRIDMAGSG